MKKSGSCPKCGGREVGHAETVLDRGYMDMEHAMSLGTKKSVNGWFSPRVPNGELEAFTCQGCGYTEFYVKDPGEFEQASD